MNFTERERQLIRLIAQGLRNKEIARFQGVSESTVKNQLDHIYTKLHIHSRVELVMYAVRNGLLEVKEKVGQANEA